MPGAPRSWNGWGFEGISLPVAAAAQSWLAARVGKGDPLDATESDMVVVPAPRPVPEFAGDVRADRDTRLRHARGMSFPDLVALRTGEVGRFPDAVVFPASPEEVVSMLRTAGAAGTSVVLRGGGTSVVGGVTVGDGPQPCVVLSLDRISGLRALDRLSRLAAFGAGTLGPEVESALVPHGLRLGHEPQSFELSSVGGWVATRSAGQRSTGVGKIDDLVAGVEVATAQGVWTLPPLPASAAGPELRRLIVGSEGRLGVITAATLRVRDVPVCEDGAAVLLPGWDEGVGVCRTLLQHGVPVEVLRLSDPDESAFGARLVELSPVARRVAGVLFGARPGGCLLLLGWTGGAAEVARARDAARAIWRAASGIPLGRGGWRRWLRERFRHPYLRDTLLGLGWGVDTLETAAPWRALSHLRRAVGSAVEEAGAAIGTRVAVLCHLSHAYADGASLYFTLFWPLAARAETAQWRALKDAATGAILSSGGTVSHHHGVGTMHRAHLVREVGEGGVALLRAAAAVADPAGTLNPGVMFENDRREVQ
ncbi:MAG: FAD-binding oxidoreductase [Acidobacteriota bacterium]